MRIRELSIIPVGHHAHIIEVGRVVAGVRPTGENTQARRKLLVIAERRTHCCVRAKINTAESRHAYHDRTNSLLLIESLFPSGCKEE